MLPISTIVYTSTHMCTSTHMYIHTYEYIYIYMCVDRHKRIPFTFLFNLVMGDLQTTIQLINTHVNISIFAKQRRRLLHFWVEIRAAPSQLIRDTITVSAFSDKSHAPTSPPFSFTLGNQIGAAPSSDYVRFLEVIHLQRQPNVRRYMFVYTPCT